MQDFFEDLTPEEFISILSNFKAKRILLVTGNSSYEASGAKKYMEILNLHKFQTFRFSDFTTNPKLEDVVKGFDYFVENNCDLIISIGGGSVIDMAKCINVFQSNLTHDFKQLVVNNSISQKGVPHISFPTTSGSGSEATHFAVIYIDKVKYSLSHKFIQPDIAVLNYEFTLNQNRYQKACSGLDALAQSIEAHWSVNSTEESLNYSRKAIQLISKNIVEFVNTGTIESSKAMSKGSYLAGRAIDISKTTAPHALSYSFTSYYNIPHGHAVFLTLPQIFLFNSKITNIDCKDYRGDYFVLNNLNEICEMLGVSSVEAAVVFLKDISSIIGVEINLKKLNLINFERKIIENINIDRLNNNPRLLSKEDLKKIIYSL
jgi:alcohol dehydrogenase class IV